MTAGQLQRLLDRARLSQRGAAKALGINERTMRKYVAGDARIPRVVELAIRCLAEHGEQKVGEIMHQKANGEKVTAQLPALSAGDELYITNVAKKALLKVNPGHDPIPPGETNLYRKHSSGVGVMVTKNVTPPSGHNQ